MTTSSRVRGRRRPGRHDIGASWISYSDMMAALLLMFVLALSYSIYQYYTMMETKTAQLDQQAAQLILQQQSLDAKQGELNAAQVSISDQEDQLNSQKLTMDEQQRLLAAAQAALTTKEGELKTAQEKLADQQNRLNAATAVLNSQQETLNSQQQTLAQQQATLDEQQGKIDDLIGLRTKIIQELSGTLTKANVKATVNAQTGDIMLDSAVFFDTGKSTIKQSGKAFLDQFIPLYLSVLMQPEYEDYLGEIIIEGHTDTQGSYLMNLELSQNRALTVATYCLQMSKLTQAQRDYLQTILTAKGKSYSNPIYKEDGTVDMEQSRRVEFQFRLKDAEMINEMNRILSGQ